MKIIYKYPIMGAADRIEMPKGASILHAGLQEGRIHIWAEVDKNSQEKEFRHIMVFGTGYAFPDIQCEHIATFQDGPFVRHVYEFKPS